MSVALRRRGRDSLQCLWGVKGHLKVVLPLTAPRFPRTPAHLRSSRHYDQQSPECVRLGRGGEERRGEGEERRGEERRERERRRGRERRGERRGEREETAEDRGREKTPTWQRRPSEATAMSMSRSSSESRTFTLCRLGEVAEP